LAEILEARSESEAVRQYTEALQLAVAAFGANVFLIRGAFDVAANAHTLRLTAGASMALLNSAGKHRLAFRPEFYFRTAQFAGAPRRWTVQTVAYVYRLDDASARRQLVGYHWHPDVQGIPFPHVHVLAASAELRRLHIAVGHCTPAHVLTFAMRDFGVQPMRNDWRAALDQADSALRQSIGE
jgi:hypothetical protein